MSFESLIAGIQRTENPTVAGLDPKLSYVPEFIRKKRSRGIRRPVWRAQQRRCWSTTRR